jgi:hypothetical protein
MADIGEKTKLPLTWAVIVGSAVLAVGITFGTLASLAASNERRITKLEADSETIARIDRRLARIEGAQGIMIPREDRLPSAQQLGP